MKSRIGICATWIILLLSSLRLAAQPLLPNQKSFVNLSLDIDHIETFFQDSIGRVWAGTFLNGLMMFNGETFAPKTVPLKNNGIHCQLPIDATRYLVGTRNGLHIFRLPTVDGEKLPHTEEVEVVGLHRLSASQVLVFCAYKIALFDVTTCQLTDLVTWSDFRLVMHAAVTDDDFILLTDKKGFYNFSLPQKRITHTPLQGISPQTEMLLTILRDGSTYWIGSDKGLMRYDYTTQQVARIRELDGICVKTLMKDHNGTLWVGTNSGLYTYQPQQGAWEHYLHNNQDEQSLLNDCIWSIYEDHDGNKWIGVDGGFSFLRENAPLKKVKWSDFIHSYEGNRIVKMLHDSRGDYWLGGINGLGRRSADTGKATFFKVDRTDKIPDNRIRALYEDRDGNVWIGTDGGVAWFDRQRQQFLWCNIENPTTGRNSVWTYGIVDDDQGNLYVATCSGGLFVVDKATLERHPGGTVTPKYNYCTQADSLILSNDACMDILKDSVGNIWFNGGRYLYKMAQVGKPVIQFSNNTIPPLPCKTIGGMLCDESGMLWGYYSNGFFRIHPQTSQVDSIPMNDYIRQFGPIKSMTNRGDHIWFLTSLGVGIIHKTTLQCRHLIDFAAGAYKSCYYDAREDRIWLGGVDNCMVLNPSACLQSRKEVAPALILADILVNDNSIGATRDLAFCPQLSLATQDNNLSFRFSFGSPTDETELQQGYYYRLGGLDDHWNNFNRQTRLIKYSHLAHGDYTFEIGHVSGADSEVEVVHSLPIHIQAPWYATPWFRLLAVVIVVALVGGAFNFYRTRTKLRLAESEKANMLKLSQMKMDFLTSMSHDLKTPLSLILAPVNRLAQTTKNPQTRQQLEEILKNAQKLSAMVTQILSVKNDDTADIPLSLSPTDIVEFVRSIVGVHQQMFAAKGVELSFTTDTPRLCIQMDVQKMESVVNNLMSNAYKFTPAGGSVVVGIHHPVDGRADSVRLTVADTGVGIAPDEQPFIFDRFYQSVKTKQINKGGSGIGLFMTRRYVTQQGGTIEVASSPAGSTFTVTLPVDLGGQSTIAGGESDGLSGQADFSGQNGRSNRQAVDLGGRAAEEQSSQRLPAEADNVASPSIPADSNTSAPAKVLLVEDNEDIASFIRNNLRGMECTVAHNGQSGLDLAQRLMPDIIVSDIMMPVMDGMEMSKLLRRNLATSTIPIILLTAKDDKLTETTAYKTGVDAFIAKPFEIEQLEARIRQLLQSKRNVISKTLQTLQEQEQERQKQTVYTPSQDELFVTELTRIIENNLESPDLNVQRLSDLSGYSTTQIYRKLKLLTGHTAVDYIKSIRLKKAAMLLGQKKFSVAEVMYMVGFSSHSYFSKCFTEKYGKSPRAYMEEL